MTKYADILGKTSHTVMISVAVVLMTAALFMFIFGIRQRRKAWVLGLEALHFGWTFYLVFCMYDLLWVKSAVAAIKWMLNCPCWVLWLALGLSLAACVLSGMEGAHYGKTHLWSDSVKQAIDALPVGICVGKGQKLYLVNVRMNEFCVTTFGSVFDTADGLWQEVQRKGEKEGERLLVYGKGRALLFGKSTVQIGETDYLQIVANDVTEQYRMTTELQEKHDKLKEVQEKALDVRRRTEELAKEKELLDARVRVHDEIGHILLLGKYYFEHEEQEDEALLDAIKQSSALLLGENGVAMPADNCKEAIAWAASIGISVELTGDVPPESVPNKVVAQAVRECATNAVKHADAKRLWVKIEQNEGETAVYISNDGKKPVGDIVLSGGLRSLRKAVCDAGGEMTVDAAPDFLLTLRLRA